MSRHPMHPRMAWIYSPFPDAWPAFQDLCTRLQQVRAVFQHLAQERHGDAALCRQ